MIEAIPQNCMSCSAHEKLEDMFYEMKNSNNIEYAKIITSLKWVIRIGSSLVAGIGIIFFMVWALHTQKYNTYKKMIEIETKLSYFKNEVKETKTEVYKKLKECQDD